MTIESNRNGVSQSAETKSSELTKSKLPKSLKVAVGFIFTYYLIFSLEAILGSASTYWYGFVLGSLFWCAIIVWALLRVKKYGWGVSVFVICVNISRHILEISEVALTETSRDIFGAIFFIGNLIYIVLLLGVLLALVMPQSRKPFKLLRQASKRNKALRKINQTNINTTKLEPEGNITKKEIILGSVILVGTFFLLTLFLPFKERLQNDQEIDVFSDGKKNEESKYGGQMNIDLKSPYLNSLLTISKSTEKEEIAPLTKWQDTINKIIIKTNAAVTYSSLRVIMIFAQKQPEEYMRHRIDFKRPAIFFITQRAFDSELGVLYDQWISIGKQNYQNAGLWSQTEDGRHDEINSSLTVNNYAEIIRSNTPTSHQIYSYSGKEYLILEFRTPVSGKFSPILKDILDECPESVKDSCQVTIWIDLSSELLSKAEIYIQDETHGDVAISQVFACYNEEINIEPPPWLNIKKSSNGSGVITDTKVFKIPHYNCRIDKKMPLYKK
jgi:hypothetical protein